MTTDDQSSFPRQRGHAWRPDWKQRLADLLARQGHASATSLLHTVPNRSLAALAEALGPGDVAAVQLEWTAIDEAKAAGAEAVEWIARDLLVRYLREEMPAGWRQSEQPIYGAFGSWTAALKTRGIRTDDDFAIMAMLDDTASPGWLPTDPDDPLLVAAFAAHWPREEDRTA
jgi:hypothetical protein